MGPKTAEIGFLAATVGDDRHPRRKSELLAAAVLNAGVNRQNVLVYQVLSIYGMLYPASETSQIAMARNHYSATYSNPEGARR